MQPRLTFPKDKHYDKIPLFTRLLQSSKKSNVVDDSNWNLNTDSIPQYELKLRCVELMEQHSFDSPEKDEIRDVTESRNQFGLILASEMLKLKFTEEDMRNRMQAWNEHSAYPLDGAELDKMINSALRGHYDYSPNNPIMGEWREKAAETLQKEEKVGRPKRLPNFGEMLKLNEHAMEKAEPLGPFVTWRGVIVVITSEPGKGKGFLLTYECMEIIKNGGTIMWIGTDEVFNNVSIRFNDAGLMPKQYPQLLCGIMEHAPESWDHLFELIKEHKPDLIVLDSLTKLAVHWWRDTRKDFPEMNRKEFWEEIVAGHFQLHVLPYHKCGIIWLHHDVKEFGKGYFGSVGIKAACDVMFSLKRRKNSTTTNLVVEKERAIVDIPQDVFSVTYFEGEKKFKFTEEAVGAVDNTKQEATPTSREAIAREWVSAFLHDRPQPKSVVMSAYKEWNPDWSFNTLNKATEAKYGFRKKKGIDDTEPIWSLNGDNSVK